MKTAEYQKTRYVAYGAAIATVILSVVAGSFALIYTESPNRGDVSAAGQIASVIPGFAGVLLAAFALTAYMKEEDEILTQAKAAWQGRNRFLFCSQYLLYSINSDIDECHEDLTTFAAVWATLVELEDEFTSSLLHSDLARALTQMEMKNGESGSNAILAARGFLQEIRYFVAKTEPEVCGMNLRGEGIDPDVTYESVSAKAIWMLTDAIWSPTGANFQDSLML